MKSDNDQRVVHVLSTSTLNLSSESDETKLKNSNDSGLHDLSTSGSNLGKFTSVDVAFLNVLLSYEKGS